MKKALLCKDCSGKFAPVEELDNTLDTNCPFCGSFKDHALVDIADIEFKELLKEAYRMKIEKAKDNVSTLIELKENADKKKKQSKS